MSTTSLVAGGGKHFSLHTQIFRKFLRSGDRGQSLVEFALTLPVMLLIVTGLMAFGITINNYLQLTDATSVGARQLAISRGTSDPCATASSAIYAAAPLLTKTSYTFKFTLNGTSYPGTTCNSAGAAANLSQGSTATVLVTYPCNLKVYGSTIIPSCILTAQTAELVQ